MICCCALAGTTACKNCNRRAEFEYPQYVIDYSKTNPLILQGNSSKIAALEHAIQILIDRIDNLEERWDSWTNPLPKDFPKSPYEGQTWIKDGYEYVYKDDVWVQFK